MDDKNKDFDNWVKDKYHSLKNGDHAMTDPNCRNMWNWAYGAENITALDAWEHQLKDINQLKKELSSSYSIISKLELGLGIFVSPVVDIRGAIELIGRHRKEYPKS